VDYSSVSLLPQTEKFEFIVNKYLLLLLINFGIETRYIVILSFPQG
jgi:hypothetical protein